MEELLATVKLGRGLWIGVFPEPSDDLLKMNELLMAVNATHGFSEIHPPSRLHVTLAHLGKSVSQRDAELAIVAVQMTANSRYDLFANMTGVLRLRKHLTIAMEHQHLMKLRLDLEQRLVDRGVAFDSRFPMIPHISVARLQEASQLVACPAVIERSLTFRGITMVCGDARLTSSFMTGPF